VGPLVGSLEPCGLHTRVLFLRLILTGTCAGGLCHGVSVALANVYIHHTQESMAAASPLDEHYICSLWA
jgi:hypothetical protein